MLQVSSVFNWKAGDGEYLLVTATTAELIPSFAALGRERDGGP